MKDNGLCAEAEQIRAWPDILLLSSTIPLKNLGRCHVTSIALLSLSSKEPYSSQVSVLAANQIRPHIIQKKINKNKTQKSVVEEEAAC